MRTAGALLAAVVLLSGCGEEGGTETAEDTSSPSETSSEAATDPTTEPSETATDEGEDPEPTSPACSDIWVAGQPLPAKYQGCFDAEKERWVEAMVYRCSSGQQLVTYRRTFYAAKGEQVNETDVPLNRDPEFKKAIATCGA